MGRELAVQFPLMLMRRWRLISHALCWIFSPISYVRLIPLSNQVFTLGKSIIVLMVSVSFRWGRQEGLKSSNCFSGWTASEKLALCQRLRNAHPLEIMGFISELPAGAFLYRGRVYFSLFILLWRIISSLISLDLQFGLASLLLPWWHSR